MQISLQFEWCRPNEPLQCTGHYRTVGIGGLGMADIPLSPQWLREEAARYFRLAQTLTDTRDSETVMAYCRELLDRAKRMETNGPDAEV